MSRKFTDFPITFAALLKPNCSPVAKARIDPQWQELGGSTQILRRGFLAPRGPSFSSQHVAVVAQRVGSGNSLQCGYLRAQISGSYSNLNHKFMQNGADMDCYWEQYIAVASQLRLKYMVFTNNGARAVLEGYYRGECPHWNPCRS